MRDIELAKLAADEARVLRDNDIELAKLTQQEELARLKSEHEKDKEIELARLHLEHEKLKMEQEIEHEKLKMEQEVELTRIDSQKRQAKLDSDTKFTSQLELGKLGAEKAAHARNPKLPYFEESKDKMDSYLSRFEKYAVANKWDRSIWAAYLSALLKGRALEVYDRLSVADANDYEKLKDALLKNFDMTERGFRKKFRNDRPERSETFIQFGSRLRSYLDKWINMAKIENTFEAICDFMAHDQFLESCSRELYVHLKPKTFKNLDEMAKEADLFAEAGGGVHTCTNKGQRDNRGAAQNHSKPDVNKGGGKQEIKCGICGLTIKCYKNPNRMQARSAEVGNEAKGGDSDAKNEMQGAQARSDSFQNKGRGNSFGGGRNFPRGRGRGGNPPRGGGHQVNFCKTQIEERSESGIENICQSKGDNSINSMTKDKEGVCYFLKSRLPTARGTVNGKEVIAMRDTGCTGCVIRSSLVSNDHFLGKASDVTLINETTQRYPLALIDIDCPFFSGQTEALCMDNTLYDVVIGNIDGSKLPDMSHFCAAVETRSQAKQCEKKYRKLKVPDQIINEDKEALKKAQAIDGNLANIRSRVKSGKVTVSRGLNRGQTKFVERKNLLYREFTKGNKVTLQLVVPEGFREKVMRNRYILTMIDYAMRYPEAVALPSIETERVAEALDEMFSRVGIPDEMLTDCGSQFTAEVMKEVSRLLSLQQLTTTPYHPMCNGLVERFHATMKQMLRRMCAELPKDWDKYLPALLFAIREVPQESLGFSPFELLYGRSVRGPMAILRELWSGEVNDEQVLSTYQYVIELRERLEQTCQLARDNLKKVQFKQKTYYDKRARSRKFDVGDKVLLLLPTESNKLLLQWKGPYEVVKIVNRMDYKVDVDGVVRTYHANMLKQYVEHKTVTSHCLLSAEANETVYEETVTEEFGLDNCAFPTAKQPQSYNDVSVSDALTSEQRAEVEALIEQYPDVLTSVPGRTDLIQHDIKLSTSELIRSKGYPVPFKARDVMDSEIKEMLELGVIKKSVSPYSSPVVLVPKKDRSVRFCIDFRKLNKVTKFDAEPMPNMEEVINRMSGHKFFTI